MQLHLITWQLIYKSLQLQLKVMLLYVLESKGSSPGRQGFMMMVNEKDQMCGSLGGGIMEYKMIELAKIKLKETAFKSSVHQQIHNKKAAKNQSGMICSGEQSILFYKISLQEIGVIEAIISFINANKNGTLQLTLAGISFNEKIPALNYSLKQTTNNFLLEEKIGYKQNLYIIGAGHCSLALSKLMF